MEHWRQKCKLMSVVINSMSKNCMLFTFYIKTLDIEANKHSGNVNICSDIEHTVS